MNYNNDDDIYTDSDLSKSLTTIKTKMDTHLSKLGQLLNIPISTDFRNTIVGLIVSVTQYEKLNYEKNKRKLESSFPKDMKWS